MDATIARKTLIENPLDAEALCALGLAAAEAGKLPQALELISQAVSGDSSQPHLHCALGDLMFQAERFLEASCSYRQALQLDPKCGKALKGLGLLETERHEPGFSAAFFRRAVALAPEDAELRSHLARSLNLNHDYDEAAVEAAAALTLDPSFFKARFEMATSLAARGRGLEAIEFLSRFLRDHPGNAEGRRILVRVLNSLNFDREARGVCAEGLAATPNDADLHSRLGVHALATGDWEEGWREYEWRFQLSDQRADANNFAQTLGTPAWTGENLEGKCLLIHCEQGLGDTIHFIRLLPELAKLGGRLIALIQPELKTLLQCLANFARVIPLGAGIPPHDYHIALLTIPKVLGTTLETAPCHVPYLTAPSDPHPGAHIDQGARLRVAFAWSTKPLCEFDQRNVPLRLFETFFDVESVAFYSVQVNENAEELEPYLTRTNVHSFQRFISTMQDTAALLAKMDLVITIDTSIAHLAGALGLRTWVMLPFFNASWRWMRTESGSPWNERSPWYPTMRLFRQSKFNDWGTVIDEVRENLVALAGASDEPEPRVAEATRGSGAGVNRRTELAPP